LWNVRGIGNKVEQGGQQGGRGYQKEQLMREIRRTIGCWMLVMVCGALSRGGEGAAGEHNGADRPTTAPRSREQPIHYPTLAEYAETLRYWSEKYSHILILEKRGQSKEGLPIFLARGTDRTVDDANKQIVLVTAMHAGAERSGATTILHFMEWLLGDSAAAAETRRKQIILLMPVVNPWGFEKQRNSNSQGIDPYSGQRGAAWDIGNLTLREPKKAPEIVAVKSVFDEFQPDVHVDLHGVPLLWKGNQTVESCGTAYSNCSLRPWDWRVAETMIAGACEAGYGIDRAEADSQRLFWGPDMSSLADRFWSGRPFFYTAMYAYCRYHTLPITAEVSWEESGVARLKALMDIGNRTWEGEEAPGYPVNVVKSLEGHWVTSWGLNAAQRRHSRAELWQRQGTFTLGSLYPQTDGRATLVIGLTAKGTAMMDNGLKTFLANLDRQPNFNAQAIRAFAGAGPEDNLYIEKAEKPVTDRPVDSGLAVRLRLSCRAPGICDLRLNGHPLAESARDGFHRWYGDGFTQVQINIPPEQTRKADLFVVTCAYEPQSQRHQGWSPPQAVLERLAGHRTE
jgi:hypothetical protein